jgi:hypothetical protein
MKDQATINLREVIRNEYKKCHDDPVYFMKKYVKIQHPHRGTILFDLYDFQEKVLQDMANYDYNIILKSRQLGITTLVSAYALWLMIFHSDKNILCISIKQEVSKDIITRVSFANDNLPSWLRVQCVEDNRLSLRLKNGSQIRATSSSSDAGRSSAISFLIIDECAFIENIESIWASSQQTLATGGKAMVLSTPNGVGNFFHKTWVAAEAKENKFNTIRLPWSLHPERNQEWRDEQTKLLGAKMASQECDCNFESSGNTVIDIEIINWYRDNTVKDPLEKRWVDQGFWIWEYPDYNKTYIVAADVARGDGTDKSAFHIIDIENLVQVAEFKGLIDTKTYGNMLVSAANEYNKAILVVENNNIGWATLQQIIDLEYPNTFYSSADLMYVDVEKQITGKINAMEKKMIPGFSTTTKTRPLIISKLESYLREKTVGIRSSRLIEELLVFIWNNSKAEALKGYNDDLVTSLGIGLWIRDTALRLRAGSAEFNKHLLNNISKTQAEKVYVSGHEERAKKSWVMPLSVSTSVVRVTTPKSNKDEDLRWLL